MSVPAEIGRALSDSSTPISAYSMPYIKRLHPISVPSEQMQLVIIPSRAAILAVSNRSSLDCGPKTTVESDDTTGRRPRTRVVAIIMVLSSFLVVRIGDFGNEDCDGSWENREKASAVVLIAYIFGNAMRKGGGIC